MKKLNFFFLLAILSLLIGCAGTSTMETPIKLQFFTYDNILIVERYIDSFDISDIDDYPTPPLRAGYEFVAYDFLVNEEEYNISAIASYSIKTYTMTFNSLGGTSLDPITYSILQTSILKPTDPNKAGYTFAGWYRDEELTIPYTFENPIYEDVILFAKWEIIANEDDHLATEELPIYSSYYGNTNGNLNNKGLVVYDPEKELHYISYQSSVYAYNPLSEETEILFTLISSGRPTFLNLDKDILYFVDSQSGYLLAFDLIDKMLTTISETENTYASRTQSRLIFTYPTLMGGKEYLAYQRYEISKETLYSIEGNGFEHISLFGTRVYYKPVDAIGLSVMSYSGVGKTSVVSLVDLDVSKQFESLLYHVDNDYVSYFALILEVGDNTGVFLYNSKDGLIKIKDGMAHSLNYDGESIYFIFSNSLYKIDLETNVSEIIYTLSSSDAYLNIINHWLYIGSYNSNTLYRINPVSKEVESIVD